MTEKIIIDGVDVAGCKDYCVVLKDMCAFGGTKRCSQIHNCYYKQLKQAENTVNECHKYQAELEDKIESLEQENKELKELIGKTRYNRLEMYESFETECNNYRSVLEEIRKTIKSYDLTVDNGASVDTLYTIKKIINEVLG